LPELLGKFLMVEASGPSPYLSASSLVISAFSLRVKSFHFDQHKALIASAALADNGAMHTVTINALTVFDVVHVDSHLAPIAGNGPHADIGLILGETACDVDVATLRKSSAVKFTRDEARRIAGERG
jgi:hypothetical protein